MRTHKKGLRKVGQDWEELHVLEIKRKDKVKKEYISAA
jgi:hypothetical protein